MLHVRSLVAAPILQSNASIFCWTRCNDVGRLSVSHVAGSYSDFEIFNHQILATLPKNATKTVRFLKSYGFWGFLVSFYGFFSKKLVFFSEALKVANLL